MCAIHIKTIRGHEYAYDVTSYWDKELRKYRKKTAYVGKVIDKEKGLYERRRDRPDSVEEQLRHSLILSFRDAYALSEYIKKIPLGRLIEKMLPEERDTLMGLVFYRILKDSAMAYAHTWMEGNYSRILYPQSRLDSQRISEFLKTLGQEEVWRRFFRRYLAQASGEESTVIIDNTGLPNEIDIPLSAFGCHGGNIERETRLLMVVDQVSGMPLYFRYITGNIVDVSTLATTLMELEHYGIKTAFALIAAGYFSQENISQLYRNRIAFLTRLPAGRVLYKQLIRTRALDLEKAEYAVVYGKRVLYVKRIPVALYEYEGYAYVVCDIRRRAEETTKLLLEAKGIPLTHEEIQEAMIFKGKFVMVSSREIPIEEVLPLYYIRQTAENLFGISKDSLDLIPLRVHSIEAFRGYLMLNFLTLILYLEFKKALKGKYTVEGVLAELTNLMSTIYDHEALVMEPTKKMKEIFSLLDLTVPISLGV
jgi:transposase